MVETGQYSNVVLEIVERNIGNLRKTAPLMPAQECESIIDSKISDNAFADCVSTKSGNYLKICGKLDSGPMSIKWTEKS